MYLQISLTLLPLCAGWIADRLWGDPPYLPHPVAGFGRLINWGEQRLNQGDWRAVKGASLALTLIAASFLSAWALLKGLTVVHPWLAAVGTAVFVFYCLAGKTLIDEVKQVFEAVDSSVEEGRKQVARIVGRDTENLTAQQVRTAALETLSENLSDGVVAPLFWFMLLGAPGMFAYKMINTLDSMLGYKNDRYLRFGRWAARIDDVANYIPARLTAGLMVLLSGRLYLFDFVRKYGNRHASPNAGYPEAALAGLLRCRFGGTNSYGGKKVYKSYIGHNPKELTTDDMRIAVALNKKVEAGMIVLVMVCLIIWQLI
jgi:adenosylcobinamide-phosphate synthase